jgi:outer membrane lipopolysaccharide assembly protein LptE/RlpB
MARLNVEVIPPDSEALNSIFAEIERKYSHKPLTRILVSEMQREAARLVRRMTTTRVTFVKD